MAEPSGGGGVNRKTERAIKRVCDSLYSLAVRHGAPTTPESLAEAAQSQLGKPIRLRPTDFAGTEVFGMWLALPEVNMILFEESTSSAHQSHIIQHELGHIMLGHRMLDQRSSPAPDPQDPAEEGRPGEQCRLMLRQELVDPQELEAEAFAIRMTRLLQAEASRKFSTADSDVARRIADTLAESRYLDSF